MEIWVELLAVLGAIWLVVLVVQLRTVAALPFERSKAKFVDARAPAALADLITIADRELDALNFEQGRWVLCTTAQSTNLFYVRVHRESRSALWLAAPSPQTPNRLNAFLITRLLNGHTVVTQSFDPWLKLVMTENSSVQICAEPGFAGLLSAHQQQLGSQETDAEGISPDGLLDFFGDFSERQRQAMIKHGSLVARSDELATPSLRFAAHMLFSWLTSKKPSADVQPVPAARIAFLAALFERTQSRAPARSVEWTLFLTSVALFMGLGALLWEPMVALVLLVVVLIHELGHYLAMRAFGYQNVHMMALPLVGGVAIGRDANPSAHRSAWMALMGPLPGILIGWAIVTLAALELWPEMLGSPWLWALMFLIINYLNVIPVPPLDGGHVVQSLLPPRSAWLEVAFIALACVLGAIAALYAGFVVLALIVLLQLLGLSGRWRLHRAMAHLSHQPPPPEQARPLRLRAVADALQASLGPTPKGMQRVNQTIEVLRRLDQKPMQGWQRFCVSATLFVMLAVPVAGAVMVLQMQWLMDSQLGAAEMQGDLVEARLASDQTRVQTMHNSELFAELVKLGAPGAARAPASEAAIETARSKFQLPSDLLDAYRRHNGAEALLADIEDVKLAKTEVEALFEDTDTEHVEAFVVVPTDEESAGSSSHGQRVSVWDLFAEAEPEPEPEPEYDSHLEFRVRELEQWLLIGESEERALLLLNPDRQAPVQLLEVYDEVATAYPSVREWMLANYLSGRRIKHITALTTERHRAAFERLHKADWDELLEAFDVRAAFPLSLFVNRSGSLPPPATEAEFEQAEARLGQLPEDYRALLERHNGHPMLGLADIGEVAPWRESSETELSLGGMEWLTRSPGGREFAASELSEVSECWNISDEEPPTLLLCPPRHAKAGVVELNSATHFPDLKTYVRSRASLHAN